MGADARVPAPEPTRRRRGGQAGDARTAGARRIAQNVGLSFSGRILGIVVGLVTVPLLARTLGTQDYGVWVGALAFVGIFSSFTEFGLTYAATMRMANDPEHEGEWLGALGSLRTLVSFGVLAVGASSAALIFAGDTRLTALVLTATIVFAGAQSLMAVFSSRLRGGVPLAFAVMQNALWLCAVVGLAVFDAGPVQVAVAYTAVLGAVATAQVLVTRRIARITWRGARARWGGLLGVAVPVGLAGLFISIYYRLDAVLLLQLAGEREAGVYGAAYRILDPLLFLPQSVTAAVFPVLSAIRTSDPARVRRLVQRGAEYMAVISLPALAVTVVLSGPIISLLFGPEFARSADVLPVLMIAFVAICYGSLAGALAPVLGLQWRLTIYAATGAAANVALNVVLIPPFGALGSAWATVVTEGLTMALLFATCLRALKVRLRLGRIAATAPAAVVMGLVMLATRPLGLGVALLAGGATYPVLLAAFGAVRLGDLRALRRP